MTPTPRWWLTTQKLRPCRQLRPTWRAPTARPGELMCMLVSCLRMWRTDSKTMLPSPAKGGQTPAKMCWHVSILLFVTTPKASEVLIPLPLLPGHILVVVSLEPLDYPCSILPHEMPLSHIFWYFSFSPAVM